MITLYTLHEQAVQYMNYVPISCFKIYNVPLYYILSYKIKFFKMIALQKLIFYSTIVQTVILS